MSIPKLSIVIPCKDDLKVVNCVRTIGECGEILIVFNGSSNDFIEKVRNLLDDCRINYYFLKKANLSEALEYGITQASFTRVLLMDSDCIFEKNAVNSFYKAALAGNPHKEVYKGKIIFKPGKDFITSLIAKSRQHHTAEILTAYKPPLMISKEISQSIGGYFFDKRLIWREDSDLDNRIRRAGINIVPVEEGIIYHDPVDLKTDLRSTFRYGVGGAIADHLQIRLTEVPRSVMSTFRSQGFMPALYMLFRNRFYTAGYIFTRLKILMKLHGFN